MASIIIVIIVSLLGGFLIRRSAETQPWRQIIQILLVFISTVWVLINNGWLWAILAFVTVFILQGIFMGLFRFIGIHRLAKKMGIDLNEK